jgi:hypothetical protein
MNCSFSIGIFFRIKEALHKEIIPRGLEKDFEQILIDYQVLGNSLDQNLLFIGPPSTGEANL